MLSLNLGVLIMQAADILAMPTSKATDLFPGSSKDISSAFHKLMKAWHPDTCADPKAKDVVEHIIQLCLTSALMGPNRANCEESVLGSS
jgi:hypothetical protein